jgi:transcriptional regulator with GAF, ATPase, and Fis domain
MNIATPTTTRELLPVSVLPRVPLRVPRGHSPAAVEEMEREHVLRAVRASNWVIGGRNGAAARLGMKRTTLAYRIQKLNIPLRPH